MLATVLCVTSHQVAHAVAGTLAGGDLVSVSTTGVEGYWSTLRDPGWLLFGIGGSAANALVALLSWLLFRRSVGRSGVWAVASWAAFAVNGWAPVAYLIASPALGFGDWMDVLSRFAALGPLRVSAVITGLFVAGLLWKATLETLALLVGGGAAAGRILRARYLVWTTWLAGGVVVIGAGLLAPAGPLRGTAIAVGGTVVSTVPVLLAAERIGTIPVPGRPFALPRSLPFVGVTVLLGVAFVVGLGPGIRFD